MTAGHEPTGGARVNAKTAQEIDTAFVPAAGFGTRMRHLTADKPKPLVEVAGRTLLDRVLDNLASAGITRAVVNVHYKADQIEAALEGREEPAITISDERSELLDTGGGVAKARPLLGTAPFIVHNADSIWLEAGASRALDRLLAAWNPDTMDCLMLLANRESAIGFDGPGDFRSASDGRLTRRGAATETPFVFTGVSVNHPRLFSNAPPGPFSLNLLWDRAIAEGRLYGIPLEGIWMHVGTPEAVEDASRLIENREQAAKGTS